MKSEKGKAPIPSSKSSAKGETPPAKPSPPALADGEVQRPDWLDEWQNYPHGPLSEKWARQLNRYAVQLENLVEHQRQSLARLSAPGIERAPWFYAPCPNCGAIEGMGLTTPNVNGELLKGYTSVWCCQCEHFGPPIRQETGKVKENDRAATMAWNAEFAAAFAAARAALAKGETDAK